MPFELQSSPELTVRRRRGLALSVGIHLLLVLVVVINPDLFDTTPTRLIRIAGEEFDPDRFEIQELFLPPELVPVPVLPPVAEAPPVPEVELPPPAAEAAPPPPPPPPPEEVTPEEPAPLITPEDVIAEGARPDAPLEASEEGVEPVEPIEPSSAGDGGPASGEDGEDGDAEPVAGTESVAEETPEAESPIEIAQNTDPDSLSLPNLRQRAEDIIGQALEEERRQGAPGRAGPTDGSLLPYDVDTEQPTILSDTRGYDFGPYMNQVINRVRFNWYSFIPEAARLGRRGRVVIIFTILGDGGVENLRIVSPSGDGPLDRAASAAIQASNPFPPIPADFEGDDLVLQFAFLYNMRN